MDNRFLAVMGLIVVGFIAIFLFSGGNEDEITDVNGVSSEHTKGNSSANVELVAYEDFGCSACGQFEPIVSEVVERYKDDIRYQFRHYPIPSSANSVAAHRAAEAAGLQGKFFPMYDLIFANQFEWAGTESPRSVFESYAGDIGIDIDQFNNDFESPSVLSTINADKLAGQELGIEGTPTFFLNGQMLDNNEIQSVDALSSKIEEVLSGQNN
jgi:protein-disulfide isomerase